MKLMEKESIFVPNPLKKSACLFSLTSCCERYFCIVLVENKQMSEG